MWPGKQTEQVACLATEREERGVARVTVSLETFHSGALPPVCAKTGEAADCLLPARAAYTPAWTWLLLLFGGLWAFLIARGFTTRDTTGLLPFSQAALARQRVRGHDRAAAAVLGAVLLLALLYQVGVQYAFLGGCVLVAFLFGFGSAWLLGVGWSGCTCRGSRFPGPSWTSRGCSCPPFGEVGNLDPLAVEPVAQAPQSLTGGQVHMRLRSP
jgi:hypothetical protein